MTTMSTSLEDLQTGAIAPTGPMADEDRVKRILAEMNAGDGIPGSGSALPPPPSQGPRVITEPPISMSTGDLRMDSATARANVIGGTTPTMADFQAMFAQASPGLAPFHGPAAVPGAMVPQPRKVTDWRTALMAQLRAPIVVAAVVFFLSLPVVTASLSRYAPWMYLGNGDISISGLLVKALLAGALFLVYQTVLAITEK
jgi:hypothetical protein